MVEKILQFDGEIFATLDTHAENYLQTAEGRHLPVPHCIKGTPGWMLQDEIAAALEQKQCTLVEKVTFGSVLLPRLLYQAAPGSPLYPGAGGAVYRHLRGVQRPDAESQLPGNAHLRGQRLLRRCHARNPPDGTGNHALLPD